MGPRLSRLILSAVPAEVIERGQRWQALRTFHEAARRVPAYRQLLREHGVVPRRILTPEAFRRQVPIIDKASYFKRFSLEQLCRGGSFAGKYTLERSSGYSGQPHYWLREAAEDRQLRDHTHHLFRDMFQAHRRTTLMVVTWSQGTWVTGEKFARTLRNLGASGALKVTVVSPGIHLEETLEILSSFIGRFEQIVLAGYPPALKDIVDQGQRQGIDWPKYRVHLLSGGEGFPESWRDYMASMLGIKKINSAEGPHIISCYGSADSGIGCGGEAPFPLILRRLCTGDRRLCADLFDGQVYPPSVFQYDPTRLQVESVEGELVLTVRNAMPLVRYNIHDRGQHLPLKTAIRVLKDHGYDPIELLNDLGWSKSMLYPLPLFYVFGRSDGVATIYGVNIYTESVYEALLHHELVGLHTGEFGLHTVYDECAEQMLRLQVRLKPGEPQDPVIARRFEQRLLAQLRQSNSEYRHLYEVKGTRVAPQVEFTYQPIHANGIKRRYCQAVPVNQE